MARKLGLSLLALSLLAGSISADEWVSARKYGPGTSSLGTGELRWEREDSPPAEAIVELDTLGPIHEMLTREIPEPCIVYFQNYASEIKRLYEAGSLDTAIMVLDLIDEKCPTDRGFTGTRILLAIAEGKQIEELYPEDYIAQLAEFYPYRLYVDYPQRLYGPMDVTLDAWIALDLFDRTDPGTVEHLLTGHYAGKIHNLFDSLRTDNYDGTRLKRMYLGEVNATRWTISNRRPFWELNLGLWRPYDRANVLGDHLLVGGEMGGRFSGFEVALSGELRLVNSREPYFVEYKGAITQTEHFFGGYIGLEAGPTFLSTDRVTLTPFGAIGYDGISAILGDADRDGRSMNSFMAGGGVKLRIFVDKNREMFIGLKFRYQIVDYNTDGGSDLSGNAISVSLGFGLMQRSLRQQRLQKLGQRN